MNHEKISKNKHILHEKTIKRALLTATLIIQRVPLSETSCELRNVLLDRVSVVGTPEQPDFGLLGEFLLYL